MNQSLKNSRKEKGQGLTEFALVVPVLLLVAFGLLDLGRAFFSVVTISNAARVGARYLTNHPEDNQIGACGNTFCDTKQAAVLESQGSFVTLTPANVTVTYCQDTDGFAGCDSGTPVIVSVAYQFRLVMGFFFPSPITLTRSAQMMVP